MSIFTDKDYSGIPLLVPASAEKRFLELYSGRRDAKRDSDKEGSPATDLKVSWWTAGLNSQVRQLSTEVFVFAMPVPLSAPPRLAQ